MQLIVFKGFFGRILGIFSASPAHDKVRSDFRFILFFAQMLDAPRLAALVEQRIAWYRDCLERMEACDLSACHPPATCSSKASGGRSTRPPRPTWASIANACSRRSGRASGWIGESDRPQTGRKPPTDLSLAETVPTVRVRRPGGPMYPMKRVNIDDLCYYPGGVITYTS